MLFAFAVATIVTVWLLLLGARELAPRFNLIDTPNPRKIHAHPTPLVGGLAVIPVIMLLAFAFVPDVIETLALTAAIALVFAMGLLDDSRELRAITRLGVQIAAGLILVFFGNVNIGTLGNLVGLGEVQLGVGAELFTLVCIVACINAFNMIDGIDGLLGSITMVILAAAAGLYASAGNVPYASFCLLSAAALLPFVDSNLSDNHKHGKVFMGDAGSMSLGLVVAFVVIKGATTESVYSPVIALFLVAVPVYDMLRVFASRVSRGISPFTAEKNHMHHVLWHTGRGVTLRLMVTSTALIAALGTLLHGAGVSEAIGFASFLIVVVLLTTKVTMAQRSHTRHEDRAEELLVATKEALKS